MTSTSKTNQYFRFIIALSRGRYLSVADLIRELQLEQRTVYRYLKDIEESPFFTLQQRGRAYRVSAESLFWANVSNRVYISDKEAVELLQIIENIDTLSEPLINVRHKVKNTLGNRVVVDTPEIDPHLERIIHNVQRAVNEKCMCILRGYNSVSSGTKTDRLVEPFCFLGSKNDVRCYELSSQMNKTFKLSRCESVEFLDVKWQFEGRHKKMHTDIFHFSGESLTRVRLLLGNLSKTILLEEYPEAISHLVPQADGRWLLDAEFCSMKGVGRFYLGLFEDIEIVESDKFKEYLTNRANLLTELTKDLTYPSLV